MSQPTDATASTVTSATVGLKSAVDAYLGDSLPDWLRRASPAQINGLRDAFTAHQRSQIALRAATVDLLPLHEFAAQAFAPLLPDYPNPMHLQWLDVRREFGQVPGAGWPFYRPRYVRQAGLLRLMQNFSTSDAVLEGSGLVAPGSDEVLTGDAQAFANACRRLDVGQRYQQSLTRIFDTRTRGQLQTQQRATFALALQIAALKGEVHAHEQQALLALSRGEAAPWEGKLHAQAGTVTMLGVRLTDAVLFTLRDQQGALSSVILYLPSSPARALHRYATLATLEQGLIDAFGQPRWRDHFAHLVALRDRVGFVEKLGKRLSDPAPDLELDGHTQAGDLFVTLVDHKLERIRDDARLLLVPTADADRQGSSARVQAWSSIGLALLNLAGLFIPTVGALLLGQLVVQTLGEVFEGVLDWAQGHQHEALEHLLGVAETLAVTAAVAGGAQVVARGFARSEFVDGLAPVKAPGVGYRLTEPDPKAYAGEPSQPQLAADGLFRDGEQRWVRCEGRFYAVTPDTREGGWRVRHPLRPTAWAPAVSSVGSRGWRLRQARPAEWNRAGAMLDALWPARQAWSDADAQAVLSIAGFDVDGLRRLLVAGAETPVTLERALLRHVNDVRVSEVFQARSGDAAVDDDVAIRRWISEQPELRSLQGDSLRRALQGASYALRRGLFTKLNESALPMDPLRTLLLRDFPGLPQRYADSLAQAAPTALRSIALSESRVPLTLAEDARDLQQQARLSQAVETLFLDNADESEGAQLTLALLERLPGWPSEVSVVLHQDSLHGRAIAAVSPRQIGVADLRLVRTATGYDAYDARGFRLPLNTTKPPRTLHAVLSQTLPEQARTRLGLTHPSVANPEQAESRLRALLRQQLPEGRRERLRLLKWTPRADGFAAASRLADGRFGYPLSGRGGGEPAWNTVRARLRGLFPELSEVALQARLDEMTAQPLTLYRRLADLEDDYDQLDRALQRWVSAGLGGASHSTRRQSADHLRWAWRQQGDVSASTAAQPLVLSGMSLESLPELPATVSFPTLTSLIITDTGLTQLSPGFLRVFDAVRELNLNGNRLLRIPPGLAYMVSLERLQLAGNRIRLDLEGLSAITGLPALVDLDLSDNPIGVISLRFSQLPGLRRIGLRRCRLSVWPEGLERCGMLERADLRGNQISSVPSSILRMPNVFRRAFLMGRNPLSSAALRELYALDEVQFHGHGPERLAVPQPVASRAHWLGPQNTDGYAARSRAWDALEAMPDSQGFFRVLDWLRNSRDSLLAPQELSRRVWSILESIESNGDLRRRIYQRAQSTLTCQNAVSDCFSGLLRERAINRAQSETLHLPSRQLIGLAQGLFRLDRLDVFIRADIRRRLDAGEVVDQLAVSLYYRVHLRDNLSLPFQPRGMAHSTAAEVSDDQLAEALRSVRDAESVAACVDSFSSREFWREYLRARHPQAFATLAADHQARVAALEARAEALTADALMVEREALQAEHDALEQAVIRQLTEQLLIGRERGLG